MQTYSIDAMRPCAERANMNRLFMGLKDSFKSDFEAIDKAKGLMLALGQRGDTILVTRYDVGHEGKHVVRPKEVFRFTV